MQKILIITPDDNTKSIDYVDWKSIQKAVGGLFEICGHKKMELLTGETEVTLYCNEEFLLIEDNKYDKVNAAASLLCGQVIRGDVAILACVDTPEGRDDRGFDYLEMTDTKGGEDIRVEILCEHWSAEDLILQFINAHKQEIKDLHKRFDKHRPTPTVELY